jgi:hypothetical protein
MFRKAINILPILILLMVKLNFFDATLRMVEDEICFSIVENEIDLTTQENGDQESEKNELDKFINSVAVFFEESPANQLHSFTSDGSTASLKIEPNNPPPEA